MSQTCITTLLCTYYCVYYMLYCFRTSTKSVLHNIYAHTHLTIAESPSKSREHSDSITVVERGRKSEHTHYYCTRDTHATNLRTLWSRSLSKCAYKASRPPSTDSVKKLMTF